MYIAYEYINQTYKFAYMKVPLKKVKVFDFPGSRSICMNVFSYLLASDRINTTPDLSPDKCTVDDNIGESIHIHLRNLRLDMTVDDFETFAKNVQKARKELENGHR